ncbi:MAG: COR domain-containing protein [Nitrospirota bacterium]
MSTEAFKKKIEQELEGLNRTQVVQFAWCCGVRALPILGHQGHFNFWKKKDRQQYLYAVFYALDCAAACDAAYSAASSAASAAAYAAASAAAYAAASAAYYAYDAYDAAYAAAASAAAAKMDIDLESILLSDLNAVREGFSSPSHGNTVLSLPFKGRFGGDGLEVAPSTTLYGEIWKNFQDALLAADCAYWGRLYQTIFDNGLVLDPDALQRRMNVPKEIREQGAAAVGNYLEQIEAKGATRLNEARIIILGDKGAGKTSIARRLRNPTAAMPTDDQSTAGVDTTLWELKKEKINVRIWDFAGHTVTHAVHQFFLSERCLYLIVYDGRSEVRNQLGYWLDQMKNYGGDSKAIILVNQRDEHGVNIAINELKEKYSILNLYTFSIGDDAILLEQFRSDMKAYIKDNPSWKTQTIPTNYYQVKDALESRFKEGGSEHITKDQFSEIADQYDVEDKDQLLRDLHHLGISLWYEKMAAQYNTLVLNPEWISHGVYQIINWADKAKQYGLTLNDFATVFKGDKRYPANQYPFLFGLMKYCELAYEITDQSRLIIPCLLKEDRPHELPDFPVGESLMLEYVAEQLLPPDTISRFIVRHHQDIKGGGKAPIDSLLVWRRGVVLEDGKGTIALVREKERIISVSVRGTDRTTYISALGNTLDDIFKVYKSKKPELQYKIEQHGKMPTGAERDPPLWLTKATIVSHHEKHKPYYDYMTDSNIPMAHTVNVYNINGENVAMGNQTITNTTFHFYDCNIGLQGHLNELGQLLKEAGQGEEAKEFTNAAKVLEEVKRDEDPESVRKKGVTNRLKRLVSDLGDENSALHRHVKGIKNGIGIAQDIAEGYNDIAQWCGLPQVPKPFLKKGT